MSYDVEKVKLLSLKPYGLKDAYIAGGAVTSVFTGNPINDIDVYFKSEKAFQAAVVSAYDNYLWCLASSARAVTFSDNGNIVQFMHFDYFPTAQDIFNAFDYTIVMGALDLDSEEFTFHDDFLKHNSQRFLRFNKGTRYPLASATRVLKYQQRGYTIGKGDILKIALACRGVEINSWDQLADQLGGAYGDKVALIGADNDKPFTLDAAIDALTVDDSGKETWTVADNDNQPGNAMDLLRKIAGMKQQPFDESRFDEDGYPIDLAVASEFAKAA